MNEFNIFDHGNGDWEKLYEFMDNNDFSCADFLAVVCASLNKFPQTEFKSKLMVGGIEFNINIEKGR